MKLTVYNGSPRAKKSNTRILLSHFIEGFHESGGIVYENVYLMKTREIEQHVELFCRSECILLAFPLYVDSMPGIVKNFIEALEGAQSEAKNPKIGFIVQSGFPEAHQSRFVEKYLAKLAHRMNCEYLGTVIKGAVEGIQIKPPWLTKKLYTQFKNLGRIFGETGHFDSKIVRALAKPEKLSRGSILFQRLMIFLGLANFYWDSQLKKNNVFKRRFDRPFAD